MFDVSLWAKINRLFFQRDFIRKRRRETNINIGECSLSVEVCGLRFSSKPKPARTDLSVNLVKTQSVLNRPNIQSPNPFNSHVQLSASTSNNRTWQLVFKNQNGGSMLGPKMLFSISVSGSVFVIFRLQLFTERNYSFMSEGTQFFRLTNREKKFILFLLFYSSTQISPTEFEKHDRAARTPLVSPELYTFTVICFEIAKCKYWKI